MFVLHSTCLRDKQTFKGGDMTQPRTNKRMAELPDTYFALVKRHPLKYSERIRT
jgi:hypothetical protein